MLRQGVQPHAQRPAGGDALVGAPQRRTELDQGTGVLEPRTGFRCQLGGLAQVAQPPLASLEHATGAQCDPGRARQAGPPCFL